jgi:hypothetical protein
VFAKPPRSKIDIADAPDYDNLHGASCLCEPSGGNDRLGANAPDSGESLTADTRCPHTPKYGMARFRRRFMKIRQILIQDKGA